MSELTVFVARHGETDWNTEGRIQGHRDIPLNAVGRDQAQGLAAEAKRHRIAAIGASDLVRARETAEIVARELELDLGLVDPDLRERGLGVFEGLTRHECERQFPGAWEQWRRDPEVTPVPGAESFDSFSTRILAAVTRAAKALSRPRKPALVVTHGGALKTLLRATVETRALITIPNGALFRFAIRGGKLCRSARDATP
jgi:broad specificity phosphatase PhoE